MKAKNQKKSGGNADTSLELPDYGNDWRIYDKSESRAELEARFFYEFARESKTIITLTRKLSHLSRGEILRGTSRGVLKSVDGLNVLHPCLFGIVLALVPDCDLQWVGWQALEAEQKAALIKMFEAGNAFRPLDKLELLHFQNELTSRHKPPLSEHAPKWDGSSLFRWGGVEESVFRIDWSLGPQAVADAVEQWFQKRKRELPEFASTGILPGKAHVARHNFKTRDEQGARSPTQKRSVALRGLAAMRLLGKHSLAEAIEISKRETGKATYADFIDPDTRRPSGRTAWKNGIEKAQLAFRELFFQQDEVSVRFRRIEKVPEREEPISYQRYCSIE